MATVGSHDFSGAICKALSDYFGFKLSENGSISSAENVCCDLS